MIRVDVEDYCQQCLDFTPDVAPAVRTYEDGTMSQTDTVIRCQYRRRCAGIKRYLEQQYALQHSAEAKPEVCG